MSDFCGFNGNAKYFNGKEWVSLKDYKQGDSVLQYNADGTGNLVKPLEYGTYCSDKAMYQYPIQGSNGMLSEDHRIMYRKDNSCSVLDTIRMRELKENTKYFIPITCEWQMENTSVDLSNIRKGILNSGEPLDSEFLEELFLLSLKDRLLYLSNIFSGNIYRSSNVYKLKVVADLLALSNEAYYLTLYKGGCGGVIQWYSLNKVKSGVGYNALFTPEYRWRGISDKRYVMFETVKNCPRRYYITVPSGMIMLKFGIHNVVVGDSRR